MAHSKQVGVHIMVKRLNSNKSAGSFIQSVDRALRVLELFMEHERDLGVSEIARLLDMNKGTVFGLLATLENRNYVERNPENGKYQLGLKVIELGFSNYKRHTLIDLAKPYIKALAEKEMETVHLVVEDSYEVVYVDKIEGNATDILNVITYIGKRNPLYCTGVGKCLLAFMEEERRENYLDTVQFVQYTKNTIMTKDALRKELEKIRQNGFSFDNEEMEQGLVCIASPIKNSEGKVVAALSLSGPRVRMTDERIKEMCLSLKETSMIISKYLGYR